MLEPLEPSDLMRDYKQVYSVKTVSGKDKLLYLEYQSNKHHIEAVGAGVNIYKIASGNKEATCINLNNKSLSDILSILDHDSTTTVTIYNYENAENKDTDGYNIDLGLLKLSFEKDKICVWNGKNKLSVYGKKDGVLNINDLQEEYYILKDGYICNNILNSSRTRCIIEGNDCKFIEYKNFNLRKEKTYTNDLFLSEQPFATYYSIGEKIYCSYDRFGMMISCIDNTEEYRYAHSTNYKEYKKDDQIYITSIHPHISDRFNYEYKDLYGYIAYDILAVDKHSVVFNRIVYKK